MCLRECAGEGATSWPGTYLYDRGAPGRGGARPLRWGRHSLPFWGARDRGSPAEAEPGNEGLETHNHHAAAKGESVCMREVRALVNKW